MAAEKGRAFLLRAGDGEAPEVFTTIGGMRATGFTLNAQTVDVTSKDSTGWRELLANAGMRSVAISGSGIFIDDVSQLDVQAKALASSIDNYQIAFESGATFEGNFQITSLEYSGEYNGERTYSLSLESSGAVTFTAA
ncbi:MAG: phage major tail protein, TP901-1 family [Emcibacter sp.]|nr:phage major tail protein, TP901-1 family [Emcibacter sp.]